jgi:hypothetical protein
VTAAGPGVAQDFTIAVITQLCGPADAATIEQNAVIVHGDYPSPSAAKLYPEAAEKYHTVSFVMIGISGLGILLMFLFVYLFIRTKSNAYHAI